ncbi:MAG: ABC transporter substrate-binding protein [Usitatibacter sp.]
MKIRIRLAATAFAMSGAGLACAQGTVNVICSVQIEWCQAIATEYQKATGVKVAMVQKGSGEALAQIAAEAANPRTDLWFGGTGDPHLQAAERGLTLEYRSANLGQLHDWARRQSDQSGGKTVGVYMGALGFGFNTEVLDKKKIKAPACWSDLTRPEFKGEIQMANPASSGTAYTAIATLVQVMGEEKAFEYLRALHQNVGQYPKSGTAPVKNVARGEATVSVSFIHDAVTEALGGFPVKSSTPCEGTGYEIGSMSIVKGARNLDATKKLYDWALTAPAQELGAAHKQFQIPSNKSAKVHALVPDFSKIKLIAYDSAKYGASAERKRLLDRWERDVNSAK